MRVIIAGSRDIEDYEILKQAVEESNFDITMVISGNARGVDKLGEKFAKENKIPLELFTANWDEWGKVAGFLRNEEMAKNADALIAIWKKDINGLGSKGTRNMISIAKRHNLKIFVKEIFENNDIVDLPLFL